MLSKIAGALTVRVGRPSADGHLHVRLVGELDLDTVPLLEQVLRQVHQGGLSTLVLDLRQLEFLDSTGVRALVLAEERAARAGRTLAIVRPEAAIVLRVLDVLGLSDAFATLDTPPPLASDQ